MSGEAIDRSSVLNINVGILGHVDAGKTALVRSLSTSLSTAALDKNPQSQQRGITLDLGFSAFTLPMPPHLASDPANSIYESIQFTLVDCPGHASLIRTIIGGAQIIDMILLVVDANKGIQTQTAECIVIGEITTDNMIVVLNKVDMIPEEDRANKLERVTNRIRKVFSTTKFAGVPIVYTAAAVGGEKSTGSAAATTSATNSSGMLSKPSTQGIDDLVELIKAKVVIPTRNYSAPFYYAIDHCFSIKGHGTVLTGTVLSGSVTANSVIELPHLQLQRKVKSLQMFRKPVKAARQGDRVGICVTNLDASQIERGIAAAPGSVPLLQSVLCLVKKVRFFRGACRSMTKFHVSIGHNTVIASAVFFGHKQVSDKSDKAADVAQAAETRTVSDGPAGAVHKQSALNSGYHRSFPDVSFSFYDGERGNSSGDDYAARFGYEYQDEMVSPMCVASFVIQKISDLRIAFS
jgi:selenocysteine-specific elongation factor